jgi:hypothetical protein
VTLKALTETFTPILGILHNLIDGSQQVQEALTTPRQDSRIPLPSRVPMRTKSYKFTKVSKEKSDSFGEDVDLDLLTQLPKGHQDYYLGGRSRFLDGAVFERGCWGGGGGISETPPYDTRRLHHMGK